MTAIVSNLEIAGRNVGLVLPLLKSDALFYELALGAAGRGDAHASSGSRAAASASAWSPSARTRRPPR